MKFKSYLKFLTKKYLPLIVIGSALALFYVLITVSEAEFYQMVDYEGNYFYSYQTTGLLSVIIIFILVMMILPFFGMGYRYSLKASDTYRQAPVEQKRIRWFNNLYLISVVVIIFTIAFFLMVALLAIYYHYYEAPSSYNPSEYIYVKCEMHFGYYFVDYLLILVFGLIQYGFSYLLISRGNTVYSSLAMLVLGEVILGFLFFAPCYYISIASLYIDSDNGFSNTLMRATENLTSSGSFITVIYVLYTVCNSLVTSGEMPTLFYTSSAIYITRIVFFVILLVIFIALGILGFIALFFEKDPSGEYAGKPGSNKPYQEIVFHTGFAFIGLLCATFSTVSPSFGIALLSIVGSLISYCAAYYVFYSLLYKNFKMPVKKYIPMFSVQGATFILSLVIAIAYATM